MTYRNRQKIKPSFKVSLKAIEVFLFLLVSNYCIAIRMLTKFQVRLIIKAC